ncbi:MULTISPECIES: amidase [unclassified Chelatococcus]|uniref:amidase n=1 Tax=unclassified Chelatococcus TaxID=2638111 RepID=UPI001BCCCD42|nr:MULTISPECIES: amidase [unclassified Chelatococcus]CAH1659523.1 Indole-3-acetamide hydrolase [Hyphomicrobiales bacterium]MBS7740956.1 amidase [Chelatococcus sp. HY11]MBX3546753.1 amidase [Chelatococcus sp.]MCO5077776.1 amidase family protein [Chelatococcus sp.]CAH1683784.1 Indole-3-acetamide hydrolase [Hyphomicrobiales bacterium]
MKDATYRELSIEQAGRSIRSREISSQELTRSALRHISEYNPTLHAFITVTEEKALADAKRADDELAAGVDRGPLHGIPYAVKDVFDTEGIRTTCHSKILLDNIPAEDSAVVARLSNAGGVLMGKLATDEFAFGGPTDDLPFPAPLNPWNTEHMTGGSSSGSAVAVSSGMVRFAIGTDTGGSIRGPAALCGLAGVKPTFGRVSTRGAYPLAYSMDHCGPLAASVTEAAIALQVLAGHDPRDPSSADVPVEDYLAELNGGVARLKIGVPRAFFEKAQGISTEALAAITQVEDALRAAGATVEDIAMPDYPLFSTCGRVILTAEAFSVHEENMRTRAADYSSLAMQRIMLGASLTAADYIQALRLRRELARAVDDTFNQYDLILTACSVAPAPRLDSMPDPFTAPSVIQAYPFSLSGHPAMSVPVGLASNGLPLSVQFVGPYFKEARVLRAGRTVETLFGWKLPVLALQ